MLEPATQNGPLDQNFDEKAAREALVRQRDQTDCGVACLASAVAYFGGEAPKLERLREMSGTGQQGTTLLGLYQAAGEIDLEAGAFEADLDNLKEVGTPCVLHVVKDGHLQHYVVCYGFDGDRFLIGDPADGVQRRTPEEVEALWQSKALLKIEPGEDFTEAKAARREKWRWLWRLVESDLNILGLAAALGLVISILGLSTAIFSQKLIDEILPAEDLSRLVAGLAFLAVLLMAKNGLTYVRRRFLVRQTRDFNNRVIGRFYGALLRLPQPFFFSRRTGGLVARMNDTRRLQKAVTHVLGDRMIDALTLLVAAAFIFYYSTGLGLIALASLPLYGVLAYGYHRPIVEGQRSVMGAHAANESNYVDTIQGMAEIKAAGKESRFERLTTSVYGFFQDQIYDLGRIGIRFNFWAETVGTGLQVAVLGLSAYLVLSGQLRLGVLVAIFQMTSTLVPAAMRVALLNIQLQEARVAFERMHEFTALEPEMEPEQRNGEQSTPDFERFDELEVHDLSFRFPGRSRLLDDVSFSVERGEMIALMGESGSGKTTLLHLLQRFYEPEGGSLTVNGVLDWDDVPIRRWRAKIGVVPQEAKIFNGTLMDNLCLSSAEEEAEAQQEAEAVARFCREHGFEKYFEAFPQGYATILGEEGANISGGQRQLVTLARALYQEPELLLLDEPTAAMDREMEAEMLSLLERLKPEQGIILASHRTQSVRRADRLYILDDGRIGAAGPPAALADGDNLFARALADRTLVSPVQASS
jgi:ATP-binding cassette subfamily B protein